MRVMALFSTLFFAKYLRVGEDGPGRGHLCHTDTFLVYLCLALWVKFSVDILKYFPYFFQKNRHFNFIRIVSIETICMKYQSPFSGKIRQISSIYHIEIFTQSAKG